MACVTLKTLKSISERFYNDKKWHFTNLNSHLCAGSQYKNLTARVISLKWFN